MNFDEKSHLWISVLGVALVFAVGYALYQASQGSSVPVSAPLPSTPTQATAEAPAQPAPAPGRPVFKIQADSPVTANTKGHQATANADVNLQFQWSIQGGTIEGSTTQSTITWSAGGAGDVVLTCRGIDANGLDSTVTFRPQIQGAPVISSFTSSPTVLSKGEGARLSWVVKDVKTLTLDPGGQDLSAFKGPGFEVKPIETTKYILKATNPAGISVSQEMTLKVVEPPDITSFRAEPVAGAGAGAANAFTVIGEFKGGKAELKDGDAVLASGETSPLRYRADNPKPGSSLTLLVTNESGAYSKSTLQFQRKTN